jgi:hypothetical protein
VHSRRSEPQATRADRRSRSIRSSPATTTSGRASRRSIAGCRSSRDCSIRPRRRSTATASSVRAPRT